MAGSLLVAKYGDTIIGINEYREGVHNYLICPFCKDLGKELRVTYNRRGYFVAWRNQGLHICGKIVVKYLDKDWIGTELVEVINNAYGEKEIIIDLFSGFDRSVKKVNKSISESNNEVSIREYNHYNRKRQIFRDVIRTVKQLKQILEKNELPTLRKLNFKYKVGNNEVLSIDELLLLSSKIEDNLIGKLRFVLFKARNSSRPNSGNRRRYLNAYTANGIDLSISYDVVGNENPFSKLDNEFVLAYGRVTKDKRIDNKYFIHLANDFHIVKVDDEFGNLFMENVTFTEFNYNRYSQAEKNVTQATDLKYKTIISAENDMKIEHGKPNDKFVGDIVDRAEIEVDKIKKLSNRITESESNQNQNFKKEQAIGNPIKKLLSKIFGRS